MTNQTLATIKGGQKWRFQKDNPTKLPNSRIKIELNIWILGISSILIDFDSFLKWTPYKQPNSVACVTNIIKYFVCQMMDVCTLQHPTHNATNEISLHDLFMLPKVRPSYWGKSFTLLQVSISLFLISV